MRKFYTKDDYLSYYTSVFESREEYAMQISQIHLNKEFFIDGLCSFCKQNRTFKCDWLYSDGKTVNFRERMLCTGCRLNNRQRFVAGYCKEIFTNSKEMLHVYFYEQVTPFYKLMIEEFGHKHNIVGSEYLGYQYKKGEIINGIRHEDAQDLSFDDLSLDMIVSQDVLEHVPDYRLALRETYRVLKENGVFFFSVPFFHSADNNIQRVDFSQTENIYLYPPIYHGNPVDANGSIVTFDYGWELLEVMREIGFRDVYLYSYWNHETGHIGGGDQFCFVALK